MRKVWICEKETWFDTVKWKSEKIEKNERKVDLPPLQKMEKKADFGKSELQGEMKHKKKIRTYFQNKYEKNRIFSGREFRIPYRSHDLMNLKDGRKKIREKRDRKSREK